MTLPDLVCTCGSGLHDCNPLWWIVAREKCCPNCCHGSGGATRDWTACVLSDVYNENMRLMKRLRKRGYPPLAVLAASALLARPFLAEYAYYSGGVSQDELVRAWLQIMTWIPRIQPPSPDKVDAWRTRERDIKH